MDTGSREPREVTFVEPLGKGGFGSVYLADVRGKDNFVQRIAVKVLNEELGDEADLVARQRDEARILAQLNHDHIVKVFDLSEIHGRPAVFMEYVAGVDTGYLLQAGAVAARAALEIGAAVASALEAAWSTESPVTGKPLHVIHRDIKPANILISEVGGVKVLDFGIARAEIDREGETKSHQYGTARYMAPEQWLGGAVGPEVDIYALGITMLELLSGTWIDRLPLVEDRFDRLRDSAVHSVRDPRWGGVWWRDLSGLVQRMLSMDPADRPTAKEVEATLLDLSEQVGGESLGRMARRRVPDLMRRRRARASTAPLVSTTDTWHQTGQELSILTGSKQVRTAPADDTTHRLRDGHGMHWMVLGLGLVAAASWMVWGWLGDGTEPGTSVAPMPSVAAPAPVGTPAVEVPEARQVRDRSRERDKPEGETLRIRLDSDPPGARVSVDGKRVGRTPLSGVQIGIGTHRVGMRDGTLRGTRKVDIRAGGPSHYTWHIAEDQWSSGY